MKKITSFAATIALMALLPFCGSAKNNDTKTNTRTGEKAMNDTGKALVVYFSATGTTKGVATRLAGAIGADIFEIVPARPYTDADLNWQNKQSRSSIEMADRPSRPAVAGTAPEFAKYTVIYLGFPIWWYREPAIIDSFVEANAAALAGKTIVPFATSGSSGMGDSSANIQALAPKAKVTKGCRFRASVDADTLKSWADTVAQ